MPIERETKDWTWVLKRSCPQCGFDADAVGYDEIPDLLRRCAARWPDVLARPNCRVRPDDSTWSALEYAAHVRDVCHTMTGRLQVILAGDNAEFADWDQDRAAVEQRYNEQDPATVGREIAVAADGAAQAFAAVPLARREVFGHRSDGARFTVDGLARYFLHDQIHHLDDVARDAY